MINSELAQAFERAADLLEIDGADAFRVNSFRKAARSIHDSTEDIASVIAASGTVSLPGVGKSTLERIKQYLVGRTFDTLAELERKFPSGLPRLLEIPGLGPKKVAAIYHTLQVKDLAELKRAIADGRLATLPGFGQASIRKIADGIDFLERTAGARLQARPCPSPRRWRPMFVPCPVSNRWPSRARFGAGPKRLETSTSSASRMTVSP